MSVKLEVSEKKNSHMILENTFSKDDDVSMARSYAVLLTKNKVPYSHKRIADSYMVVKRIYKFQAVSSRISNVEQAFLAKYGFSTLESTTVKKMCEELDILQKAASSEDTNAQSVSEKILEIRTKELKFLDASRYTTVSNEIYNGYLTLQNYFEEISRYKTNLLI